MKDFVIIANGPFLVKEIILEAIANKTIIALDGAANKLAKLGITPHVILGDFDSIKESTQFFGIHKTFNALHEDDKPYRNQQNILIVPAKNQDKTDLSKAIDYCDTEEATSITILCAAHGREDHHQSATRSLLAHHKKNRPITFFTELQILRAVIDDTITLHGHSGDMCGVVAAPRANVTSLGLKYEMNNYELIYGHSESTSNALLDTTANLIITGSALVILPPTLASHRTYAHLPEIEQLEQRMRDLRG